MAVVNGGEGGEQTLVTQGQPGHTGQGRWRAMEEGRSERGKE